MIKQIIVKYFSQLLVILTVAGLSLFAYKAWRDHNEKRKYTELIGTKEKYEQLTKYTAKLESQYKSEQELYQKAKEDWENVKKTKDERIKLLSDATYLLRKRVQKQDGPDYYFETAKGTRGFLVNELNLLGNSSPPVGFIMITNDGKTYKRNYRFEILVKSLQTIDENNGKVRVYSKAFFVLKEPTLSEKRRKDLKKWEDVQYELPIIGGVAYIDPTMPDVVEKIWLWAPHLNAGFSLGVQNGSFFTRPALSFSIAGFGKTKNDLSWKILHFGFDSDTDFKYPGINFTPFSYRFLPSILTNTYIGPGIGITQQGMNYQLNINLSL